MLSQFAADTHTRSLARLLLLPAFSSMEDHQLPLSNKSAECADYFLVLKLSEEDPLFEKKKKILETKGFGPQGHVFLENSSCLNWPSATMEILVKRATVICSDEVELYFSGVDEDSSGQFCSPIIGLEALHLLQSLMDDTLTIGNHMITGLLQDFRKTSIDMVLALGDKFRLETKIITNYNCDKEKLLLQWGEDNGVQTKLEVAYVEGAGRGAIATEDLQVGDIAVEIPVSLIISEELVHESDMFPILEKIDGISSDTMLLLWSMKEKHNYHSRFKYYFDALPEVFNTGLSFGINAIMALDGTLLLEEIVHAKEHLRTQYDDLFPALYNDHPEVFPAEFYTWEQFLWACELWYSNGMKVMLTDGKLQTCLVPIAGFLNHSLCPHILHYGIVDPATSSLKFRLSRPCNAGEQCYLSYGKFSSSHLVTFYGFLPEGDNPYDIIPLDLDAAEANSTNDSCPLSDWTSHMVRGTWLSKNQGIFHYGLPPPLLNHFRRALSSSSQTNTCMQENLETELEILEALRSTFEDMMDTLGDANLDSSANSTCWDVKLAMKAKDIQRSIVSSIVTSCHSGTKLVEYELSKCRA